MPDLFFLMLKTVTIHLQPIGESVKVSRGTPLIDVLHEFGIEFPCGGKGTCGRCKVKLLGGSLKMDPFQQQKLNKLGLKGDWRLACFCSAEEDITLEISQFENIILADSTQFRFKPKTGHGIAFDLGTTTLVAQLVNLENGHILRSVSDVNPQVRYGADLISRIQSCLDGNQTDLQLLIRQKADKMIHSLLKDHPVEISKINIVGNTAMHHIFSGISVAPLSQYPFYSPEKGSQHFTPEQLNWNLNKTDIHFYPSIGSFVGSDILAGIAATRMAFRDEFTILVDLGTNGEIVVGNRERIVCASTAAGPAFEGAKISQGMRASTGAISSVTFENGKIKHHVIGNVPARGICGSGLIDAIAGLIETGQIGIFGEFENGEEKIEIAPGVAVTQQDIREFQLAKAAVATGIQILMNKLEISFENISQVFIAGGFGNFLNIGNVIRTGLIECEAEKIVKFGNTALIGAKMFLFEEDSFIDEILVKTTHVNLEADPAFQDIYIEKMMLM